MGLLAEILHRISEKRKERKRRALLLSLTRKSSSDFGIEKISKLVDLVSSENFPLLLEYLELTISENLVMLSSIELLDDERRKDAIKLQNQTRGILFVRDLVEDLKTRSRELVKDAREKEDERNS